jgi:hypothetical protein
MIDMELSLLRTCQSFGEVYDRDAMGAMDGIFCNSVSQFIQRGPMWAIGLSDLGA